MSDVYTTTIELVADANKALSTLKTVEATLSKLEKSNHKLNIDTDSKDITSSIEGIGQLREELVELSKLDIGELLNGRVDTSTAQSEIQGIVSQIDMVFDQLKNEKIVVGDTVDLSGMTEGMLLQVNASMKTIQNSISSSFKTIFGNAFTGIKNGVDPVSIALENPSKSATSSGSASVGKSAEEMDADAEVLDKAVEKINAAWRKLQTESTENSLNTSFSNFTKDYSDFAKTSDEAAKEMEAGQEALDKYIDIYQRLDEVASTFDLKEFPSAEYLELNFDDSEIVSMVSHLKECSDTVNNAEKGVKALAQASGYITNTEQTNALEQLNQSFTNNNEYQTGVDSLQAIIDSYSNIDTSKLETAQNQLTALNEDLQTLYENYSKDGRNQIDINELFNTDGWDSKKLVGFANEYNNVAKSVKSAQTEIKAASGKMDLNQVFGDLKSGEYQKQIDDINNSISKLGDVDAKASLNQTSQEIQKLYENLKTDVSTGNLKGVAEDADALNQKLSETNNTLSQLNSNNSFATSLSNGLNSILPTLNKIVGYNAIFREMRQVAQDCVSTIREVDSAMNQLEIVTGATASEMDEFFEASISQAKELGQSVTDVLDSIQVYSRLGYNLEEASELAEYTSILSNVADVGTEEATQGLTSVIKGFDMSVDDAEHVADVLIDIGQSYAVSASEILEAFTRSSAAFGATGTTFEEASAIIAAGNAAVQDASTVGVAMKTVSARIRQSKTELDELGESYDDLADGFSKYRDEILQLTGFDIMEEGTTNDFKSLYDIFDGIAGAWDKLTETQQSRVSEILGGATCSTTSFKNEKVA